jgi:predicted DNA-binding protein
MAESPMVGARVPMEWQVKLRDIAQASGKKEASVVREAIAYLSSIFIQKP